MFKVLKNKKGMSLQPMVLILAVIMVCVAFLQIETMYLTRSKVYDVSSQALTLTEASILEDVYDSLTDKDQFDYYKEILDEYFYSDDPGKMSYSQIFFDEFNKNFPYQVDENAYYVGDHFMIDKDTIQLDAEAYDDHITLKVSLEINYVFNFGTVVGDVSFTKIPLTVTSDYSFIQTLDPDGDGSEYEPGDVNSFEDKMATTTTTKVDSD